MKILKISIKNYRSCKATSFSPHNELTALIGPNGSGKTNILSAIKLLSSFVSDRRRGRYKNKREEEALSSASELKTSFEIDGKTIIHTAKIDTVTNERNGDEILSTDENWYMHDITRSKKKIKIPPESSFFDMFRYSYRLKHAVLSNQSYFPSKYTKKYLKEWGIDEKAVPAMISVDKFLRNIRYYSASQFTNPANCPISFEVEGRYTRLRRGISIGSIHEALLYDLYIAYEKYSDKEQPDKEQPDAYSEYLSIVGPEGIGLIDDIEFKEIETSTSTVNVSTGGRVNKKEKTNLLVVPRFHINGDTLSPNQLSEGTFRTLALIFYLITDKSSLLMIEEPEVCVHHGLLDSIIELINNCSKEKQIIISTHSDTVLDSLNFDNVFAVKRLPNDGTEVRDISKSMKNKEKQALKEYLASEGNLGEYWKHGDLEDA